MRERKKIWTPYKIWDETEWFIDFDKVMEKFKKSKKSL